MNRHIRKFICLAAAASLAISSFSGCGSKDKDKKTEGAMGRYLEEETALPEHVNRILAVQSLKDGRLALLGETESQTRMLWTSKDSGKTWEEQGLPQQLELQNALYLDKAVISPNGDLAGLGVLSQDSSGYTAFYSSKDGNFQTLDIDLPQIKEDTGSGDTGKGKEDPEEEPEAGTAGASTSVAVGSSSSTDGEDTPSVPSMGNMVMELKFTESGQLLAKDLRNIVYLIDPSTGAILQTYNGAGESIRLFEGIGDKLLTVTDSGAQYYDIASGDPLEKDEEFGKQLLKDGGNLATGFSGSYPVLFAKGQEKDTMFYCSREGIFRRVMGGNVMEQVVNGALNSMGSPNTSLIQMLAMEDGSFLLASGVDNEAKLLRYTYSARTPAMPEKELKVYSLTDNAALRRAISMFQKQNAEVYVNLEIGMTGEDGVTSSDALRTLNTNIMAGKGPDVLILDGMPVNHYIQKGLLEDISGTVEEVNKAEGIFENIKNTYGKKDKLYAIPMGFLLPAIQGDTDTVQAAQDLQSLAERMQQLKQENPGQGTMLEPQDGEALLKLLYDVDSVNWQNQDGTLKEEAVRDFLTQAKTISDTNSGTNEDNTKIGFFTQEAGGMAESSRVMIQSMSVRNKTCLASAGLIGSVMDLSQTVSVNKSMDGITYGAMETNGKHVFIPYLNVGISSKSNEKGTAASFLKTLLGKEVQTGLTNAFPINKKGYEGILKSPYGEGGGAVISLQDDTGVSSELQMDWPSQEELDIFENLIEKVDTPALTDDTIWNAVKEQGQKCLAGSQSVDDGVKNIMQKVNLYLAE